MWFLLILILGILTLAFWMWKRPDPVKRDQAKAVGHDLWLEQLDAQLKFAERLTTDVQPDYLRAYELYQNMAKQHEIPQAYVAMGLMQLKGLGREASVEHATSLLEKAFQLGSDEAAYYLGQMAEAKFGANADAEKAVYWYRHAVARGHLEAQYRLAELNPDDQTQTEQQQFKLLEKNAAQGHANSQYQLAQYYLNLTEPNLSLGLGYLFEAAAQDHLAANQLLKQIYESDQYFPSNQEKALHYLKRCLLLGDKQDLYEYYQAVLMGKIDIDQRQRVYHDLLNQAREQKIAAANRVLGLAHFHGWHLEKQEKLGFSFLSEAARQKDAMAITVIAALYFEKYLVSDDPAKAFELYKMAYQLQPNFFNQMGLAMCYLQGIGHAQHMSQAQKLMGQAAEEYLNTPMQCVADQNYVIGRLYSTAEYPLPNRDKALSNLNKSVEQGSAHAAWYLYRLYTENTLNEITADAGLALAAVSKAAKLGHAQALTTLAKKSLDAKQIPQDLSMALKCLNIAVEKNNADAMTQLGQLYEHGLGVKKDINKALAYYLQAAEQMNADALSHLGRLYIHGEGVERDLNTAKQYLQNAAVQRHVHAIEQLENIHAFLGDN